MTEALSPYIEYKDVQVEYPGYVTGLSDVSLRIQKGDFVFFVGKTGAGKSTLIKLLTREVRHTKGIVTLQGKDLGRLRSRDIPILRREMGIVPQDFALLPRKRVWENVAYAMRAVGHTRSAVRRKVPEILDQVNIGHRADAYPHQLSGGEQQRVAIARALINNPPLLIADEPTGNLDPDHSWEIMELLKALNLKGTTVLVASHDIMVIHRVGRRIVTLDGGRISHDTETSETLSPVEHSAAFVPQSPIEVRSSVETRAPVEEQSPVDGDVPVAIEVPVAHLEPTAVTAPEEVETVSDEVQTHEISAPVPIQPTLELSEILEAASELTVEEPKQDV